MFEGVEPAIRRRRLPSARTYNLRVKSLHSTRWRIRTAGLSLGLLLAWEIAGFPASEFRGRWGAFVVFSGMTADEARLHGSSFAFDRRLGWFLEGVEGATPPVSTVALPFFSPEGNVPTYAAAYVLAPRRTVDFSRLAEADYAAGPPGAAGRVGKMIRIPFGELSRLR